MKFYKFTTIEDDWNEQFPWFLVDDGKIQYSFREELDADLFAKQSFINYMLLVHLDNLTDQTMLDPAEYRSWSDKISRCLIRSNIESKTQPKTP